MVHEKHKGLTLGKTKDNSSTKNDKETKRCDKYQR